MIPFKWAIEMVEHSIAVKAHSSVIVYSVSHKLVQTNLKKVELSD